MRFVLFRHVLVSSGTTYNRRDAYRAAAVGTAPPLEADPPLAARDHRADARDGRRGLDPAGAEAARSRVGPPVARNRAQRRADPGDPPRVRAAAPGADRQPGRGTGARGDGRVVRRRREPRRHPLLAPEPGEDPEADLDRPERAP